MHSKFIVHRDLKMSNILIHNKSIYKIADLGFCKILNNPVLLFFILERKNMFITRFKFYYGSRNI